MLGYANDLNRNCVHLSKPLVISAINGFAEASGFHLFD